MALGTYRSILVCSFSVLFPFSFIANPAAIVADLVKEKYVEKKKFLAPENVTSIAQNILETQLDTFLQGSTNFYSNKPPYYDDLILITLHPKVSLEIIEKAAKKRLGADSYQKIQQELNSATLIDIACKGKPKNAYDFFKLIIAFKQETCLTPTQAHLVRHIHKTSEYLYFYSLEKIKPFLKRVIKKEKEIINQGMLSFLHAAQENIVFLMDMYTQGYHVINHEDPSQDYLFMRFDKQTHTPVRSYLKNLIFLAMRKKIMSEKRGMCDYHLYATHPLVTILKRIVEKQKNPKLEEHCDCLSNKIFGKYCKKCHKKKLYSFLTSSKTTAEKASETFETEIHSAASKHEYDDLINEKIRKRLVFLNIGFLNNLGNSGSSTANYFWNSCNVRGFSKSTDFIGKQLGLEKLFSRYKTEFNKLRKLHTKIANGKGVLIQFGFTPEKVKESVYLAKDFGYTTMLKTIQGDHIDDVTQIQNQMRTNIGELENSDIFELCFIATNQKPNQGIKMYRQYYGDQQLVKEYFQKRDALFAKIRTDYKTGI